MAKLSTGTQLPQAWGGKLLYTINGRKPFRKFKDALIDLGDLRDQWFQFEEKAHLDLAQQWLEDRDIDAELIIRNRG